MEPTLEFDCRTICDGKRCPHLTPFKEKRFTQTVKIYVCLSTKNVLWPIILHKGSLHEKLLGISPLFECDSMLELRKSGQAPLAPFTILPNGKTKEWNEPKTGI